MKSKNPKQPQPKAQPDPSKEDDVEVISPYKSPIRKLRKRRTPKKIPPSIANNDSVNDGVEVIYTPSKPRRSRRVKKTQPAQPAANINDVEVIYTPSKPKSKRRVRKTKVLATPQPVTPDVNTPKNETGEDSTPGKMGRAWNRLSSAEKVTYFLRGGTNDPESTPIKHFNKAASKHVKNFTPPHKIGTPGLNPSSPPLSMISRSGEKLELVSVFGDLAVYAKTSSVTREPSHALTEQFVEARLQDIRNNNNVPAHAVDKIQTYDSATAETPIKKSSRSQKAVMDDVSATDVVKQIFDIDLITETLNKMSLSQEARAGILEQFEEFSAEWLHLIDYAKKGEAGQIQGNLIFGSKHANSTMMVIESYASDQIKKGHHIKIEVKATGSIYNVARKIEMIISDESTNTKTTVEINPFTRNKPVRQSRPLFELHLRHQHKLKLSKPK